MNIFAFGDSITYGSWDPTNGGWAALLRRYLDEKAANDDTFFALLYNLGIPGETTDGLVKRFSQEVTARERANEEKNFLFAFGANDSCKIKSRDQFRVSVDQYRANLEHVITQAQGLSDKIVLLNTTPVVDRLTVNPEGKDKSRLNEYIVPYNQCLQELGNKLRVDVIDVNTTFMAINHELLFCEDGLHPNEQGHQIIFEQVKKYLINKNWM